MHFAHAPPLLYTASYQKLDGENYWCLLFINKTCVLLQLTNPSSTSYKSSKVEEEEL